MNTVLVSTFALCLGGLFLDYNGRNRKPLTPHPTGVMYAWLMEFFGSLGQRAVCFYHWLDWYIVDYEKTSLLIVCSFWASIQILCMWSYLMLNSEAEWFWGKWVSLPQRVGWVFSGASWFLFILLKTRSSVFGAPFSREPLELPETWSQLHNIPVKIGEGWNNFLVSGRIRHIWETETPKLEN